MLSSYGNYLFMADWINIFVLELLLLYVPYRWYLYSY
jgi:hypothetical protein